MSLTINAEQRDALYEQIIGRLSGIGDVWLAVNAQDYAAAERLGREFSDSLSLVIDDLGWGEGGGEVQLSTPPHVLRRALTRLRAEAIGLDASEATERAAVRESERRNRLAIEACAQVLADLDGR